MNILFIEANIPPYRGGIAMVSWQLSKFFEMIGHHTFYAYFNKDFEEVEDSKKLKWYVNDSEDNLKAMFLSFVEKYRIQLIINQGNGWPTICNVLKLLKDKGVIIVSCLHTSPEGVFLYKNSWKFPIKNILYKIFSGHDSRSWPLHRMYEISDRMVLLSPSFVESFTKLAFLSENSKIVAIGNPCPFQINVCPSQDERKKQVLIISRMDDPQKNITGALRIWKTIEEKGFEDWQLIMGGYGDDEKMILDYAKSLGIKRLVWKGIISDTLPYYQESPIFMMTSRFEGWGLTLIEALQNGCIPIVFNSFSAVYDIIEDNYNGCLIDFPNEGAFAEKLEQLMFDKEERTKLSLNGGRSVERYSVTNIGEQWCKLIEEIENDKHSSKQL